MVWRADRHLKPYGQGPSATAWIRHGPYDDADRDSPGRVLDLAGLAERTVLSMIRILLALQAFTLCIVHAIQARPALEQRLERAMRLLFLVSASGLIAAAALLLLSLIS